MSADVLKARGDFPALAQSVNGHPLVYLDHAATSLKPVPVIESLDHFYRLEAANVHRGAHHLSDQATEKYEETRIIVQKFLNAKSPNEILFTKGTTESINLVASTYGDQFLSPGDEIILTEMEHHSNIVPWQMLAKRKQLKIRWIPINEIGELDLLEYDKILSEKIKLVSIAHCSNVLGTVNDLNQIVLKAHAFGAKVMVDAAQSVTFMEIDVQKINCDFLAFSGHKLYGPFGTGVLFGKEKILNTLKPYQGGGSMISTVTTTGSDYLNAPHRFEAGTPNVAGVIALGEAIQYVLNLGLSSICEHESELLKYMLLQLSKIDRIRVIGESSTRVNLISIVIDGLHTSDIGQILDQQGVAVRTGHHCAQPLMTKLNIPGTLRASFGVYNSREDVDIFIQSLKKALEILT